MRQFVFLAALFAGAVALSGLLAQSTPGSPASKKPTAFDKAVMEAYVRNLYAWPPQIQVQVNDPKPSPRLPGFSEVVVHASQGPQSTDLLYYVSTDGQKILKGDVYDVSQNPFKAELDKLKTEFQPSFGTPGASVVIVEFSDFQCPFCKEEAQAIRENLLKAYPKDVRFYFKDFPLEQIHPWAKPAAIAGRCVFRANAPAFWDYHDWIYANQASVTAETFRDKFMAWANEKKLDTLQIGRCFDNKATLPEVEKSMAEARALDVNQTPYLFINGRRFAGARKWEELKYFIDFELNYQKTAKNAGEQACCTLELPTPGKK